MNLEEYGFNVEEQTNKVISWIRDWFKNNGNDNTNTIVGISGGKDSAVVAALCVKALGKDRVIGVMLPCGNQVDINDSKRIIEHLGIKSFEVNIGNAYNELTNELRKVAENGMKFPPATYSTNTPARIRMTALYGVGAIIGNCRVVNTCQISENINSYATFYGDSAGDFAPIDMLTTDEVIAIGDYLGLPYDLVHKIPTDGMSLNDDGTLKGDEAKLGYTYRECNELLRLNKKGPNYEKIMKQYHSGKFKLQIIRIPHYDPNLPISDEFDIWKNN